MTGAELLRSDLGALAIIVGVGIIAGMLLALAAPRHTRVRSDNEPRSFWGGLRKGWWD